MSTFNGPARAIKCAERLCAAISGELNVEIRAGVHTGECELLDGGVAGLTVHVAARVSAKAEAGQVLVSRTVRDLIAGSGICSSRSASTNWKAYRAQWNCSLSARRPSLVRHSTKQGTCGLPTASCSPPPRGRPDSSEPSLASELLNAEARPVEGCSNHSAYHPSFAVSTLKAQLRRYPDQGLFTAACNPGVAGSPLMRHLRRRREVAPRRGTSPPRSAPADDPLRTMAATRRVQPIAESMTLARRAET